MHLLDDLRNCRRYWELKEEAEDKNRWKRQLSLEPNEEIQVLFHKSIDLLKISVLNNIRNIESLGCGLKLGHTATVTITNTHLLRNKLNLLYVKIRQEGQNYLIPVYILFAN